MSEPTELPGEPAPIGARLAAGFVDGAALLGIAWALYYIPLRYGALALPLLGALVAILGWVVIPCAVFRGTLGMRLLNLQIIGMDGRKADLLELLSRELLGRGFIGFAYYSTAVVGYIGLASRNIVFFQPRGVGLVLFFFSGAIILLSFCGQVLIFTRRDRRGLPDLMAKTIVIRRGTARPEDADLDEEEKRLLKQATGRSIRNVAVFDLLLLACALAFPYFLSRPSTAGAEFAARVKIASAEREFNANPSNNRAAEELMYLLEANGEKEKAAQIEGRHSDAVRTTHQSQEEALKHAIESDPTNWDAAGTLIDLYEDTNRLDDATAAYRAYVEAVPEPDNRAGFGIWLYDHGKYPAAITELKKSIEDGDKRAEAHAYLGWALSEQGNLLEARTQFQAALEIDPDLEEVEQDLAATIQKLEGRPETAPQ